jgi:DNA-binding transcriptional LysR family regulator
MDWRKIRTFYNVSGFKSFSEAARVLDKSQSTLSRDILTLEKDLGFKLFLRNTDGIKLTSKGANLLNIAKEFDQKVRDTKNL